MGGRVKLFISAGPDLESEREAIGRALAQFPINLGWEIKRTPRSGQPPDLQAARGADVFLLLFGSDIQAPVGSEWMTARGAQRPCLAFLKQGTLHTPAGQEFSRYLAGEGRLFRGTTELIRQILEALSTHILEHWQQVGLSGAEWEKLSNYRARLRGEKVDGESDSDGAEPGGAGEGGVILAPGRDAPKGGVVVET
jgi:hypothetical protein